ncbi:MAG: DnaJ domain-containing protein [Spirochaetota bacterium]
MNRSEWIESTRVLGVREEAGIEEIQAAYRKLVMKLHPDVNRSREAPVKFRQVVEAYGKLVEMVREQKVLSGQELLKRVKGDPVIGRLEEEQLEERLRYSGCAKVRTAAVLALADRKKSRTKKLLLEVLKNDPAVEVKRAVLQVIGNYCTSADLLWFLAFMSSAGSSGLRRDIAGLLLRLMYRMLKIRKAYTTKEVYT